MVRRIEFDNRIEYRNENGELHRDDGPAIIYPDGDQFWYKNGECHREDGPAIILDGVLLWHINGKLHRDDGPAVIYPDGEVDWLLNDTMYPFKEWCELMNISDEEKIELALKYG